MLTMIFVFGIEFVVASFTEVVYTDVDKTTDAIG